MANFLLTFYGGSMPETQEEGAKVMAAWTDLVRRARRLADRRRQSDLVVEGDLARRLGDGRAVRPDRATRSSRPTASTQPSRPPRVARSWPAGQHWSFRRRSRPCSAMAQVRVGDDRGGYAAPRDPAGETHTATFLMTDIAGSTRLWEEQRDAMVLALAAHDALLRAAVEEAGGTVFKTTGDGLLAAFERPGAAVRAAARRAARPRRTTPGPPRRRSWSGWRSTPATPSFATTTTSGRRSTAWPGCSRSATADRSSSRRRPRRWSPTTCRRARRCSTGASTTSRTSPAPSTSTSSAPPAWSPTSRRSAPVPPRRPTCRST